MTINIPCHKAATLLLQSGNIQHQQNNKTINVPRLKAATLRLQSGNNQHQQNKHVTKYSSP